MTFLRKRGAQQGLEADLPGDKEGVGPGDLQAGVSAPHWDRRALLGGGWVGSSDSSCLCLGRYYSPSVLELPGWASCIPGHRKGRRGGGGGGRE
jgi:hypothetical protein